MSWFTGASDALEQALVDQEAKKRQAMLDSIAAEERKERGEDRRTNREIQRINAEALKEQREAAAAKAKQDRAMGVAKTLGVDANIDADTAALLGEGGLSALVKPGAMSGSMNTTAGLPTALGGDTAAPAGPAVQMVQGSSRFRGTAEQVEKQKERERRSQYVASLPAGSPVRAFLEAQDATGDASLPAGLFEPPKVKEPVLRSVAGVGLVQIGPDGKPKVVMAERDKPTKPTRMNINGVGVVEFDGQGNHRVVVPVPAKAGKTPADIEEESYRRTLGANRAKKEGEGPGLDLSGIPLLGRLFPNPISTGAPASSAAGGAAGSPKVGDKKTFPNGKVGVWDGNGWVAQ